MRQSFDENRVQSVATAVAEAFELAATGEESWDLSLRLLNAEFPNAFFALVNQDFLHDRINQAVSWNLDPSLLASYMKHYAFINPYQRYWIAAKNGEILSTESNLPVSDIRNTEFYNDWLCKTERRTESIGLKLDPSPTDTIYVAMHTPEGYIDLYGPGYTEILARLRSPLNRAVRIARTLQQAGDGSAARAALVNCEQGAAFVVDNSMYIVDANAEAVALLRKDSLAGSRGGRLYFRDKTLSEQVAFRARELASSALAPARRIGWDNGSGKWLISMMRLPGDRIQKLLTPRTQILLRLTDLATRPVAGDLTEFARLFRLTPAETRLAAALGDGLSLADAATGLCITFETARQRLKQVFQKTGTAKQSELCVMLNRFHSS